MWSPHRMCQRRSHTLSFNRKGENISSAKKRLNLVTQDTGNPPPGTSSTRRGRPGGRGARARVPVPGLAGGIQTRFGVVVTGAAEAVGCADLAPTNLAPLPSKINPPPIC
jgi:hypothetical protein